MAFNIFLWVLLVLSILVSIAIIPVYQVVWTRGDDGSYPYTSMSYYRIQGIVLGAFATGWHTMMLAATFSRVAGPRYLSGAILAVLSILVNVQLLFISTNLVAFCNEYIPRGSLFSSSSDDEMSSLAPQLLRDRDAILAITGIFSVLTFMLVIADVMRILRYAGKLSLKTAPKGFDMSRV